MICLFNWLYRLFFSEEEDSTRWAPFFEWPVTGFISPLKVMGPYLWLVGADFAGVFCNWFGLGCSLPAIDVWSTRGTWHFSLWMSFLPFKTKISWSHHPREEFSDFEALYPLLILCIPRKTSVTMEKPTNWRFISPVKTGIFWTASGDVFQVGWNCGGETIFHHPLELCLGR